MTKQEFLDRLKSRLLQAGFTEEASDQRCAGISRGFAKLSEDEARQYFTNANIDMLVERLVKDAQEQTEKSKREEQPIRRRQPEQTAPPKKAEEPVRPMEQKSDKPTADKEKTDDQSSPTTKPTIVIPKSDEKSGSDKTGGKQDSDIAKVSGSSDVVFVSSSSSSKGSGKRSLFVSIDDSVMSRGSQHPKLLLAAILALCAPMFLFIILSVLGLSLGIALVMASVILAVVCVIAAIVCGGSILSALSLIYGITQIISEPRYVGYHEIGLAMLFAGATILISVLLYNVAVRLIPYIYKLIGMALKTLFKKIKDLIILAWKGCKNL